MRKIFDIAFKDMIQLFRSLIALVMMFGVPILLTGMFYIMFGGSEEDGGTVLPVTNVVLVNQDAGGIQFDEFLTMDIQPANLENGAVDSSPSMGEVLSEQLQAETFNGLMNVSIMDDPELAISAVDKQEAGVAILIPENFSEALTQPGGNAAVIFHYDPGLTVGPNIVKGIVQQFLDNFNSAQITLEVTFDQLIKAGIPFDEQLAQAVVGSYFQGATDDLNRQDLAAQLNIQSPTGEEVDGSTTNVMVSMIMAGMTVFYVFFTGASTAQSLLTEDIKGTLGRLFTTPIPRSTVLGGKMVSGILMILVQITVLLLFGNLVFQIEWGQITTLLPLVITLTLAASAFGIFLMSWPQTERQAGLMMGSVVTIMGMLGMLPIFVLSLPNPPRIVSTLSHLVPQGWAVEGLQISMEGGILADVILNSLVMIAWAVLFFILGVLRFRKRFA